MLLSKYLEYINMYVSDFSCISDITTIITTQTRLLQLCDITPWKPISIFSNSDLNIEVEAMNLFVVYYISKGYGVNYAKVHISRSVPYMTKFLCGNRSSSVMTVTLNMMNRPGRSAWHVDRICWSFVKIYIMYPVQWQLLNKNHCSYLSNHDISQMALRLCI